MAAAWLVWPEEVGGVPAAPEMGGLDAAAIHLVLAALGLTVLMRLFALLAPGYGRPQWQRPLTYGVLLLATGEIWINRPHRFESLAEYWERTGPDAEGAAAVAFARFRHIPLAEVRHLESAGRNAARGLATPDNGAPAVVPARNMLLRTTLFEVEWEGLLPLGKPKFPHSLRVASVNTFNGWIGPEEWFAKDLMPVKAPLNDKGRLDFDRASLPRAYLAAACVPSSGPDASAEALADPHFALGTAWVERLDAAERTLCARASGPLPRRVAIKEDAGTRVALVEVEGPGVLVLNDTFFPGWQAYDTRTQATFAIRPANLAFRAVFLPEPRLYDVVFRYRPAWLALSGALVLAGLAAATGLLVSARRSPDAEG